MIAAVDTAAVVLVLIDGLGVYVGVRMDVVVDASTRGYRPMIWNGPLSFHGQWDHRIDDCFSRQQALL